MAEVTAEVTAEDTVEDTAEVTAEVHVEVTAETTDFVCSWGIDMVAQDSAANASPLLFLTIGLANEISGIFFRKDVLPTDAEFVTGTKTIAYPQTSSNNTPTKYIVRPLFANGAWGRGQEATIP
jgi:hypothetical protein